MILLQQPCIIPAIFRRVSGEILGQGSLWLVRDRCEVCETRRYLLLRATSMRGFLVLVLAHNQVSCSFRIAYVVLRKDFYVGRQGYTGFKVIIIRAERQCGAVAAARAQDGLANESRSRSGSAIFVL